MNQELQTYEEAPSKGHSVRWFQAHQLWITRFFQQCFMK